MKNNIRIIQILISLYFILFLSEIGKAQQLPEIVNFKMGGIPSFYYDIFTTAADSGKTKCHIFMKIAYDELQFVQREEDYKAQYEISAILLDQKKNQIDGKITTQEVLVQDFKKTNSGEDFSFSQFTFFVFPGEYTLRVAVTDMDSKQIGRQKLDLYIADYSKRRLDVSTLLFIDEILTDSSGQNVIVPNVLKNYRDEQTSLYIWYEIYNRMGLDSVYVSYKVIDHKNKIIRKGGYYKVLTGETMVDTINLLRGELESGRYKIEVELGDGDDVIHQENYFTIHWLNMPVFSSDLDLAIQQLKFIANSRDIRKMKKAKKADKEVLFMQFWGLRDPTPGTTRNELMEEYYRRVYYSNAAFSSLIDGWKSDRGMIYIIFGPPDEVDRHPFDSDQKPYEVWGYYGFGKAFVFQDHSGFGDYRLTQAGWEILNQYR